uniref:Uncharacterized protein n=1 Tax=Eimeria tenella TaxID=5802 RepID=H9B9R4_EIMTE|nr:hypothetical protein [Eimeria tenella]
MKLSRRVEVVCNCCVSEGVAMQVFRDENFRPNVYASKCMHSSTPVAQKRTLDFPSVSTVNARKVLIIGLWRAGTDDMAREITGT